MRELDPKSPHVPRLCRRRRGPSRHGARRGALDAPALRARRADPAEDRGASCCACRTARSRPRPRRCPPARCSATAPARPGSRSLDGREGFSPAPADVGRRRAATPSVLRGAGAAVDGTSDRALDTARALGASARAARDPRRRPRTASPTTRPASIAANFLVALEACAERLAATAGHQSRATRAARARHGAAVGRDWARKRRSPARSRAATRATVARHRATIARAHARSCSELWDALADATRAAGG